MLIYRVMGDNLLVIADDPRVPNPELQVEISLPAAFLPGPVEDFLYGESDRELHFKPVL